MPAAVAAACNAPCPTRQRHVLSDAAVQASSSSAPVSQRVHAAQRPGPARGLKVPTEQAEQTLVLWGWCPLAQ